MRKNSDANEQNNNIIVDFDQLENVIASDKDEDFIQMVRNSLLIWRSVESPALKNDKNDFIEKIKSVKLKCKNLLEKGDYNFYRPLSKIHSFIGLAYLITKKNNKAKPYLEKALTINNNNFIAIELMMATGDINKDKKRMALKEWIYNCESGDSEFYTNVALFFAQPLLLYNANTQKYSLNEKANDLSDIDKRSLELYLAMALALNSEEAPYLKAAFEYALGNKDIAKSLFEKASRKIENSQKNSSIFNIDSSILKHLINESKLPILVDHVDSLDSKSLGKGGCGVVKIEETQIGKLAKKTNKNQECDHVIESIINEINAWEKVSKHPEYFAPLLAIGLTLQPTSLISFYMPIFSNSSLDNFLPNEAVNEEKKADWILSLGLALSILHTKFQIAHADIKPGNILVNEEGNLRITDFGEVAKLNENHEYSKGTPDYQSPELLRESSEYWLKTTDKNDIWALGLVFLFILTNGKQSGWEKWRDKDPNKSAYDIQEEEIQKGEEGIKIDIDPIPEDKIKFYNKAKEIVNGCLLFNPEKRSTVEEIIEEAKTLNKDCQSP